MASSNYVSIDVEKLATSIMKNELEKLPSQYSKWCIQIVPKRLRRLNESAYTPQMVSIGPLHRGSEKLEVMEEQKKWHLRDFLQRTKVSLVDLLNLIKERETKLRSFYAETINLNSDVFAKMILVDAVFIIEVFSSSTNLYNPQMMKDISFDLFLLENQLPFFILKDIFGKIPITSSSFTKLTYEFFKKLWNLQPFLDEFNIENQFSTVHHMVDLLRIYLKPQKLQSKKKLKTLNIIPSLRIMSPFVVKVNLGPGSNMFDMNMEEKILRIPELKMEGTTETLILNLLAYEQYHCSSEDRYVNDYIVIMSQLLKTEQDENLLVHQGIAENWLGNNTSISNCFQRLVQVTWISVDDFYFSGIVEMLDACYNRSTRNKWLQVLRTVYFGKPWAVI